MKRILNPATNPAGWSAALALAYALAQGVVNVHAQHKALTAPVVVAIAGGVLSWWIRGRVTPVADPKDGSGNPLTPGLGDPERRRAEDLRLMFAPGSPSFYPYPGEQGSAVAAGVAAACRPAARHHHREHHMTEPSRNIAIRIAREFHETYERLAPATGYETRKESAVPWDVPIVNRTLMTNVVAELMRRGVIAEGPVP